MHRLRSTFLLPESDTRCRVIPDGLFTFRPGEPVASLDPWPGDGAVSAPCTDARDSLILPAFYDLHFHWVQDRVRLKPKASLLQWLEEQTFPEEARFANPDHAESAAREFWNQPAARGIVGGLVYSSIHDTALEAAMRHAGSGFRVGNVLMTRHVPPGLTQTTASAIRSVETGLARCGERYVVSPRFAPVTDPETLRAVARLAHEADSWIQTHLSETPAEIERVLGLYRTLPGFGDVPTYTDIYDRCGLLGPRTVFGHGIYLSATERHRLADSGAIIAHCPSSNAPVEELGLGSGLFDFQAADAAGLRWGLASDIGGGPYLNPFDVIRSFLQQNRRAGISAATPTLALYRATTGNAKLLGEDGVLAVGSPATFVSIPRPPGLDIRPDTCADDILEEVLRPLDTDRTTGETLVRETWINGHRVFCR